MDGQGCSPGLPTGFVGAADTRRIPWLAGMMAVAVVGLFALWGAAPSHAESTEWRLGGAALGETVTTTSTGTIKITDKGWGSKGATVECEDQAEMSAKSGGAGELTKWTATNCKGMEGECEAGTLVLEATDLPWATQLYTSEKRMTITPDGNGFKWQCKIDKSKVTDQCKSIVRAAITNTTDGVTAAFGPSENTLECTKGGAGEGSLESSQSIETATGGKLSAATPTEVEKLSEAFWLQDGTEVIAPLEVSWYGTVRLAATARLPIECGDSATGKIKASRGGEITSWTAFKCASTSKEDECKGGATAEALNLPWHTELVNSEGTVHDVLVGSGHGAPGYKWKCSWDGEQGSECTGVLSLTTPVGDGGVTATFNPSEKLNCTKGGTRGGTVEGKQEIKLVDGDTVGVGT